MAEGYQYYLSRAGYSPHNGVWDLTQIIPIKAQCFGHAKTTGQRCGWNLFDFYEKYGDQHGSPSVQDIQREIDNATKSLKPKANLTNTETISLFDYAARRLLCGHHSGQARQVSEEWWRHIVSLPSRSNPPLPAPSVQSSPSTERTRTDIQGIESSLSLTSRGLGPVQGHVRTDSTSDQESSINSLQACMEMLKQAQAQEFAILRGMLVDVRDKLDALKAQQAVIAAEVRRSASQANRRSHAAPEVVQTQEMSRVRLPSEETAETSPSPTSLKPSVQHQKRSPLRRLGRFLMSKLAGRY